MPILITANAIPITMPAMLSTAINGNPISARTSSSGSPRTNITTSSGQPRNLISAIAMGSTAASEPSTAKMPRSMPNFIRIALMIAHIGKGSASEGECRGEWREE
jgi:hypothetical protein